METANASSILDSKIYVEPESSLDQSLDKFSGHPEVQEYLYEVMMSTKPKDDDHQERFQEILEGLLEEGKDEEAGLLFNLHRTVTEFRGYGANDKASSDVMACFGEEQEIPETGYIVVDFFVARNLPKVVEVCEQRGIDLGRIRVCVPQAVLALQLMMMNDEKRVEFEAACIKLREDQFIIEDVNHNADIVLDGEVAIWFSPRTMPITPRLSAESEEETAKNFCEWFNEKLMSVVDGGRIYANLAYSEEWKPLSVEVTEGRRRLTKLTGISRGVTEEIAKTVIASGFRQLGKEEFNPADVDPQIDHAKLGKELHVVRG